MSDPIPHIIYERIKVWVQEKAPCQILLNVSPDRCIVDADCVTKEHVKADVCASKDGRGRGKYYESAWHYK